MRRKVMLLFLVINLVLINYGIYAKEHIKKHGDIVLLELAPVDPRSLMQGDYMILEYKIERVASHKSKNQSSREMVVRLDDHNVAQFVRIHKDKEALVANEKLIHFYRQGGRPMIKPRSFLFQEGHAKYYEDAKYGVFKFHGANDYLLVGLADENRTIITVPDVKNNSSN